MKVVAGSYERFLWGWQMRSKNSELRLAFSYPAHRGPVKSIAACGSIVATGGSDDTIKIFDVSEEKDMGSLYKHDGAVTCLDFFMPESSVSRRPTHLFSGSEDGTIGIWDTDSWVHLKSMKGHKSGLNSLTVHPSGRVILSVEKDGHMKMWNLLNGRCTYTAKLASEGTIIKFSPQSGESYALVRAEFMDIYNVETGTLLHSLEHERRVLCLAQNEDGLIFTAGEETTIRAWDTRTAKLAISVPKAHSNRIRGVCLLNSPDSAELPFLIGSASSDGSVRVWDTRINQSSEDKAFMTPAFETVTKARLTCLVSCGSAKKLQAITHPSSRGMESSQEKASNGAEDHTRVNNGLSTKFSKQPAEDHTGLDHVFNTKSLKRPAEDHKGVDNTGVNNGVKTEASKQPAENRTKSSNGVSKSSKPCQKKQIQKALKQSEVVKESQVVQAQEAPKAGKRKRKRSHVKSS